MTWPNEPERHSLASRGISTTAKYHRNIEEIPPRELYSIDYEYIGNYWYDLIKVLKEDKKWGERLDIIEVDKSIEHSRKIEKLIQLFWWCSTNDAWGWFDFDLVAENIKSFLKGRKEFYSELSKYEEGVYLKSSHKEALELAEKYNSEWNINKKILWFDEIIHMEHERGLVIVEVNMSLDALRKYFEEKYL